MKIHKSSHKQITLEEDKIQAVCRENHGYIIKKKNLKKLIIWKQPRCPPADKWIRKVWYIHTMEYYSAIKRMKHGHL